MAIQEMRMKTERTKVLLLTNKERFNCQLQEALDRGWAEWAKQATELHTYWADQENRQKEGNGFYKQNEEIITMVHKDLVQEYQALADDHHLEEIA